MEIYHAYLRGDITVIVVCPNNYCDNNIWIDAHVHGVVDNIGEAASIIADSQRL